ncbi:GNAT family N-acetyltransferase [Beijerinckia sp. L45]|uniref:GNAT family N-acetyltransferase n=1 Tax=Beijerinckia sp. L45 TaxID=1641855 RepID=UPI001FF05F76|nr:GNAT family N-acetyltransferase [Beijerinckia sp. L45]
MIEIGPAWTDLWLRTDSYVFQRHDWVMTWWETIPDRKNRKLNIVLAWRDAATLDAILPLASKRRSGFRVVEWAAKDYVDYADGLVNPELDRTLIRTLWDKVWSAGGFDIVYLNRLLPEAKAQILTGERSASQKLRPYHRRDASLRVCGPWPTGDAWFQAQTKKARQNYRRGLSYLGERGTTGFRLVDPSEPLAPIVKRLSALKRQKDAAQKTPLFDDASTTLTTLVEILAAVGVLRIFVLECDGLIVAASVNFVKGDTMMAFVTAYDADFQKGSPGVVLMMDYIKWSIDHGSKTIDFLFGEEDFKHRFATQSVSLDSMVGARSLAGAVALALERIYRGLKTLPQRLRIEKLRRRAFGSTKSSPAD